MRRLIQPATSSLSQAVADEIRLSLIADLQMKLYAGLASRRKAAARDVLQWIGHFPRDNR